jgi:hypothetical protein
VSACEGAEQSDVAATEPTALIHAELDDELSSAQRAELARLLLAEPQLRALRDELESVCNRLGALGQVPPPMELKNLILERLPPPVVGTAYRRPSLTHWRIAALLAGLLTAATIVYESVQGPTPGDRETAGTLLGDASTTLDSASVRGGPLTARAILYRDKMGLSIGLEISAVQPVDVVITTGERSMRINGLGASGAAAEDKRTIALGAQPQGQSVELSFLIGERTVSQVTLHAKSGS